MHEENCKKVCVMCTRVLPRRKPIRTVTVELFESLHEFLPHYDREDRRMPQMLCDACIRFLRRSKKMKPMRPSEKFTKLDEKYSLIASAQQATTPSCPGDACVACTAIADLQTSFGTNLEPRKLALGSPQKIISSTSTDVPTPVTLTHADMYDIQTDLGLSDSFCA